MSSFDQYSSSAPSASFKATSPSSPSPSSSTPRRPTLRTGMTYAPSPRSSPVRSFSLPSTPPHQTATRRVTPGSPRHAAHAQAHAQAEGLELGLAFGSGAGSTSPESGMGEKEIYMGALVSPVQMNEKRSIDVPCIILTEPDQYLPPSRTASPPPKQIILLPSSSLALPLHSGGSTHEKKNKGWKSVIKTVLVFGTVGLGLWHVWSVLGQFEAEHGHGHGHGQFQNQI